jgi:hypothetical protein
VTRQKSALFQGLAVPLWFPQVKIVCQQIRGHSVHNFAVAKSLTQSARVRDTPASAPAANAIENRIRLSERIGQFMNQPTERGRGAGCRVEKHSNRARICWRTIFPVGNHSGMASH